MPMWSCPCSATCHTPARVKNGLKQRGQSTWSKRVVKARGQSAWSKRGQARGQSAWSKRGQSAWSKRVFNARGQSAVKARPMRVTKACGQSVWSKRVVKARGQSAWSKRVVEARGQSTVKGHGVVKHVVEGSKRGQNSPRRTAGSRRVCPGSATRRDRVETAVRAARQRFNRLTKRSA